MDEFRQRYPHVVDLPPDFSTDFSPAVQEQILQGINELRQERAEYPHNRDYLSALVDTRWLQPLQEFVLNTSDREPNAFPTFERDAYSGHVLIDEGGDLKREFKATMAPAIRAIFLRLPEVILGRDQSGKGPEAILDFFRGSGENGGLSNEEIEMIAARFKKFYYEYWNPLLEGAETPLQRIGGLRKVYEKTIQELEWLWENHVDHDAARNLAEFYARNYGKGMALVESTGISPLDFMFMEEGYGSSRALLISDITEYDKYQQNASYWETRAVFWG